jgi:hypothetical protein
MNIFQKIREVKLPFLAVIGALVFGGIVAPASAAGTSVTGAQFLKTTVNRGTSSSTGNETTALATLGANETFSGGYMSIQAASPSNTLAIQAGDSIKVTATYTNVTSGTTATSISMSWLDVNGLRVGSQVSNYANANFNATGSNNTVTGTATPSNLPAGTYESFYVNVGVNITDAAATANDQLRIVTSFTLVRGGVETALTTRGTAYNNSFRVVKTGTLDHTLASGDQFVYSSGNFCIFNNQNGVTNNTQIDITVANTGTATLSDVMINPQNGMATQVNGVYQISMPASNWTRSSIFVHLSANNPQAAQTWAPTISAVIHGTSTNVLDLCSSQQVTPPAPAQVTATVRPLPQINFAANPVNGVSARPTADTRKGTLTIEGSNLSDLTSITIGGKAATFTVKDGKLDIKLPAGVTGFPEVVMTNASGSITMQNAIEIYAPTVQKLTKFVGERLTLAGMETLENLYINNKTATALEATVVVAPDATEAEIAKAVAAATKAVTYIDKVGKRIVRTAVTVSKTGEAGTKPSIEMSFTK